MRAGSRGWSSERRIGQHNEMGHMFKEHDEIGAVSRHVSFFCTNKSDTIIATTENIYDGKSQTITNKYTI